MALTAGAAPSGLFDVAVGEPFAPAEWLCAGSWVVVSVTLS